MVLQCSDYLDQVVRKQEKHLARSIDSQVLKQRIRECSQMDLVNKLHEVSEYKPTIVKSIQQDLRQTMIEESES